MSLFEWAFLIFLVTCGVAWPLIHCYFREPKWLGRAAHRALRVLLIAIIATIQFGEHYFATLHPVSFSLDNLTLTWNAGSMILIPLTYLLLLYFYVTDRPPEFGTVLATVVVSNIAVITVSCNARIFAPTLIDERLWSSKSTWTILLGTISLIAGAIALVATRSGVVRTFRMGVFSRTFWPLIFALAVDSILFSLVLKYGPGSPPEIAKFESLLYNQTTGKLVAGLVLSLSCSLFFRVLPPHRNDVRREFKPFWKSVWAFYASILTFGTVSVPIFDHPSKSDLDLAPSREEGYDSDRPFPVEEPIMDDRNYPHLAPQLYRLSNQQKSLRSRLDESETPEVDWTKTATALFERDWPQLVREHDGEFVAYVEDEPRVFAKTVVELDRLLKGKRYIRRMIDSGFPPVNLL
jgi:hypothetical protein